MTCVYVLLQSDRHTRVLPEVCRYEGPALIDERLSMHDIVKVSGVINGAISNGPVYNVAAAGIILAFYLQVLLL